MWVHRQRSRTSSLTQLTYDNFPFALDMEINNRKRLGRYFLEAEMWYLLYNIVRAGHKFEKIKKKVGDVRPYNILINEDGQIKVLSVVSLPNELNNFQKAVEDKNAKVYLGSKFIMQRLKSSTGRQYRKENTPAAWTLAGPRSSALG